MSLGMTSIDDTNQSIVGANVLLGLTQDEDKIPSGSLPQYSILCYNKVIPAVLSPIFEADDKEEMLQFCKEWSCDVLLQQSFMLEREGMAKQLIRPYSIPRMSQHTSYYRLSCLLCLGES